jgi:DNA-binding transcriptional LysR family regulator
VSVEVRSKLHANDARVLRDAARRGIGIAVLPEFLVLDDIRKGDLVSLLEETPIPSFWLKAIVPRIKLNKPAVHELIEYLKKRMQPTPPWESANTT